MFAGFQLRFQLDRIDSGREMNPVVSDDKMKKAISCKWHLAGISHCHSALAWERLSVVFESLSHANIAPSICSEF